MKKRGRDTGSKNHEEALKEGREGGREEGRKGDRIQEGKCKKAM